MGVLRPKTKTIPNNEYIDENISTNAQCPSKAMKISMLWCSIIPPIFLHLQLQLQLQTSPTDFQTATNFIRIICIPHLSTGNSHGVYSKEF